MNNGRMGLICFVAWVWTVYHIMVTGYTFEPREIWMLSVIILVASIRFLILWNREAHEAYSKYRRENASSVISKEIE